MNVTEVVIRVKRQFGDESSIQITDQDIIRWINDAQERIVVDNSGVLEATGTTSTVAGQKEYSLPSDLLTLHSLSYKGYHLKSLSFNEFNTQVNGYKAPDGINQYPKTTPEYYMVWNNSVWLHPVPDIDEEQSILIYYTRHPTPVASLADNLSVPLRYHNAVVDYVLGQAYEMDENLEAKQMKETEFSEKTTKLNALVDRSSGEVYPSITVLPGDDFGWC